MRALSFTAQKHGINRQRVKAGAKADQMYDLVNGYVTGSKSVVPREGTARDVILSSHTRGLTAFDGLLQTFSDQFESYTPVGYLANVLAHPTDDTATLVKIHFAQPFMNALYVVAEWSDGGVYHYWLASSGPWQANKVYFEGDVVTPTTPNGLLYKAVPHNALVDGLQTWAPLTNYNLGDRVLPTTYNGFYFEVTDTAGDVPISGPTEPAWNASEGAPTTEATDASGSPAANASADSAPAVPPDVRDRYGTGQTQLSDASAAAVGLSDTIPLWTPGTVYQPGDLVKPRSVSPVLSSAIPNADFESGDVNWTKDTGWTITSTTGSGKADKPYQGAFYAAFTPQPSGVVGYIKMATTVPVIPGQFIQASCYGAQNGTNNPNTNSVIVLLWYDEYNNLVKETEGTTYGTDSAKDYRIYNVQDTTPGDAVKVKVGFKAWRNAVSSVHSLSVDSFAWNYVNLTPAEADFTTYQAVQASAGTSGASEPVWPGAGNTVVDNQVTWLGGVNSVITWTAYPIMKSGATEPDWVEQVGSAVLDNTISWTANTGFVDQAPNSKIVVLGAKKVFAGDDDIVRYSATVNPLDWTTEDDAGYLPTGLNTYGANPVAAMGLYRGNLMVYNSGGFQMWQIDEDPELIQLLDAVPVGSTYHHALQSVKNDQILLTQLGYRNVSIAGGSTNLQAGDFGQPIDPLVQAELRAGTYEPNSFYYPARGQYWGIFGPQVFVCTFNDDGRSWSRYEFPETITGATLLDDALYLRTSGHKVWRVDPTIPVDDYVEPVPPLLSVEQDEPGDSVQLTWVAAQLFEGTPDGYDIHVSVNAGAFTLLSSVVGNVLGYNDETPYSSGDVLLYYVTAVRYGEANLDSNQDGLTFTALAPVLVSVEQDGPGQDVDLGWTAASFLGGLPPDNYEIYVSVNSGGFTLVDTVAGNVLAYADPTGYIDGDTLLYYVKAKLSPETPLDSNELGLTFDNALVYGNPHVLRDVFTMNGTWVKPGYASSVRVLVVGKGGTSEHTSSLGAKNGNAGGGGGQVITQNGVAVVGNVSVVLAATGTGADTPNSSFGAIVALNAGTLSRGGYAGTSSANLDMAVVAPMSALPGQFAGGAAWVVTDTSFSGSKHQSAVGGGGGGAGGAGYEGSASGAGGVGLYMGDIFGDDLGDDGWFGGGGGGSIADEMNTFGYLTTAPAGGKGGGGLGSPFGAAATPLGTKGVDGTGGGGGGPTVTIGGSTGPNLAGGTGLVVVLYYGPP